MTGLYETIADILGIGSDGAQLGSVQLSARAVTIYLATLLLVRLGPHRFFDKNTAFDVVIGFIFGSMLSRAINGSDTLFQTVVAALVMLGVHGLVTFLASRERGLKSVPLESALWRREGESAATALFVVPQGSAAPKALPLAGRGDDDKAVLRALIAQDPTKDIRELRTEPRILDVHVADGVQTVRIALG